MSEKGRIILLTAWFVSMPNCFRSRAHGKRYENAYSENKPALVACL